jgi:Uma2 family endonuclease
MSEAEFERWCDEDTHAEFIDGTVVPMGPVTLEHADLRGFIAAILREVVEEHDLGRVFADEVQIRLRAGLRRVPDLLFVGRQRLEQLTQTFLEGPPDVAFEIVSLDSVERDWRDKYHEYEAAGVSEYWVIDPLTRTLRLYLLQGGAYSPAPLTDGRLVSRLVPGFWLRPEWLWSVPMPRVKACLAELGVR